MRICAYAFANTAYFFEKLIEESRQRGEDIEWSVVLPRWHHRHRFMSLVPDGNLLYLYENFDSHYSENREATLFGLSAGEDGELLCLLKDKGGYLKLDGKEQLRRAATVIDTYREFLLRVRPDYLLFPDLEVVDGFLLLSLCRSLEIKPVYYVGMRFLGGGFFSDNAYEKLPPYYGAHCEGDLDLARKLLTKFLAGEHLSIDMHGEEKLQGPSVQPLWQRMFKAAYMHLRYERKYVGEDDWLIRIKSNLGHPLQAYRRWYFVTFQRRWFDIQYNDSPLPRHYVLYALQYTPESSINGLEPYYVDQLRVIDLLLAALPSGYRLLVKEHPAIVGVRSSNFYRLLRRKPGVVLVTPMVSTSKLVKGATVVASVTGTIGLESYLLGKPCILFGRNFFSHLCAAAEGPLSIKGVLAAQIENFRVPSEEERARQLARLLHVRYPILLSDATVQPEVLSNQNISAYMDALKDHINRLATYSKQG